MHNFITKMTMTKQSSSVISANIDGTYTSTTDTADLLLDDNLSSNSVSTHGASHVVNHMANLAH